MCLGIPGRVVEMVDGHGDQLAMIDVEGVQRTINIGMLDEPRDPGPGCSSTWGSRSRSSTPKLPPRRCQGWR